MPRSTPARPEISRPITNSDGCGITLNFTGYRESGAGGSALAAFQAAPSLRSEFLGRFTSASEKPTAFQTSILHALTLMNGKLIAEATSLERSETLAAVADAPFMNTRGRIEALYLAALSLRPERLEIAAARQAGLDNSLPGTVEFV